ncbi:TetR family transcriptional regulator [Arthrobacter livingstonensis]|uniref:TetR family transcriptional regulator n=1 Tax=Arthrobacter livingstonensis TaxID=670078 RepID=A0A2V5L4S4_9MICC|nr:TetR/AcrR family transcriptional regulator [Arthrobacter livingstonensis]PYI66491.1 TetR family transcriptional regulator [Arthrobacter livingstonensis]
MSIKSVSSAALPERRGRGRRPAAEVRGRVVDAAATLLFEQGLGAVTFDKVAALAASSKTTLYKWWPSAGALAAEAYFARVEHSLEFPDTGGIEADLRTQLRAFVHLMTEEGAGTVIVELIGAAQTDPALRAAFSAAYSRPRRDLAIAALQRARDRGQLRDGFSLDVIVDQLWGACYHRLLIPDEPLTLEFADELVRNALHGAVPGRD